MKRCNHTCWLSLASHGGATSLLETDRLEHVKACFQEPDSQQPSLVALIGNTEKSASLRQLFGVKRPRWPKARRGTGEIHLHVDSGSVFGARPLLVAEGDLFIKRSLRAFAAGKCHEVRWRSIQRDDKASGLSEAASGLYSQLLFPFTEVFCFFSDDLGGFRQIARHLAAWLEQGCLSTLPRGTHPRIIIVTGKVPQGAASEAEARKAFLWLLREETSEKLSERFSNVEVIALLPHNSLSADARYRLLKERLKSASEEVRRRRAELRSLFSMTHLVAFLRYACEHFVDNAKEPFDFIQASRTHNPVGPDLRQHLSNFLRHSETTDELIEFAAPVIASCFFRDNYLSTNHCKRADLPMFAD